MGLARKIGCGCLVIVLLLVAAAAGIWVWKPWTQIVPLEMVEPTAAQGERVDTGDVLGNFYPAKGADNGPGVLLIGGWLRGKALLQILLEAAFEGVDRQGWLKLSRNWGIFFVLMAGLNEVLRMQLSFESWLWAKLWVFMPLSFLFTFTQIPMLLKHGLALEDRDEVVKDEPPTA